MENHMESSVRSRKKKQQEKGFTLIETATALLVMMIGGLGICAVFAYAIKNNTGSRDRALALAVAQQQMERYRQMKFIDASLTAHAETTETVTSADSRTYTVRTTITDTTTTMKTIKIEVTPQLSPGLYGLGTVEITVQRSTFELGIYQGA
jgi:Tfp pilus assembly protein PilV